MEHVEAPEQALGGRSSDPAPQRPDRMRSRKRPEAEVDVGAGERRSNPARPLETRGGEGDDLVLPGGYLDEPRERATDVVPDPERRMAQRAHVHDDPHLRAPGW